MKDFQCDDVGIQCVNLTEFTTDSAKIQEYLEGTRQGKDLCCYGFTVEVLKSLASDLNFKYQVRQIIPPQGIPRSSWGKSDIISGLFDTGSDCGILLWRPVAGDDWRHPEGLGRHGSGRHQHHSGKGGGDTVLGTLLLQRIRHPLSQEAPPTSHQCLHGPLQSRHVDPHLHIRARHRHLHGLLWGQSDICVETIIDHKTI